MGLKDFFTKRKEAKRHEGSHLHVTLINPPAKVAIYLCVDLETHVTQKIAVRMPDYAVEYDLEKMPEAEVLDSYRVVVKETDAHALINGHITLGYCRYLDKDGK